MNLLLYNPAAGSGLAERIAPKAESMLKARVDQLRVARSERPGHAEELARSAANDGARNIFVLGGDGTVIEAARGVYPTRTALALIPAGTGNDFRKSLNIPSKWDDALLYALKHDPIAVDAGMINGRLFVNECGAGFDTVTLEYALLSKRFTHGKAAYLYGVIRAMLDNKPVELTVVREDGTEQTRLLTLFGAANGGVIGGGIPVSPEASVFDGMLDVVTVPAMPRRKLIRALALLLRGKIAEIPGAETFRCAQIAVRGRNLKINVDGEITAQDSALIKIVPGALMIRARAPQ
ncbi:MAG: YegS/Rv2252/BmrU family lipid kinase [Oscillospiraceae bacterium]|jgi:YegS/Rv2252/BmrU family lipid kinase|nr:YegS/Rv2252/BmrU family lipid kinase [Oscillospiraceae bacterium]